MTTTETGRQAEAVAAAYLIKRGYKILERNWRTRYCEIDIVAKKQSCVYFVEVKYRISKLQGDGFDYITTKKLRQMSRAAEFWLSSRAWDGSCSLAAIEVAGQEFEVTGFTSDIE